MGERYEILSKAGQGGMGVVYEARDRETGARVALKKLYGTSPEDVARMDREIAILRELTHPGIVGYVDHGVGDDGALFYAMEWVEGDSLSTVLDREGGLDEATCERILRGVLEAMAAAHEVGCVHRDLKPANLMVTADGAVKVLDFGLARLGAMSRMTVTGQSLGTPGYMAPEQARGLPGVDARADVFSIGLIAFELFAGRRAYEGDHVVALLSKLLFEPPPRLREARPDAPAWLDALIVAALAPEPADRPADAAALLARLDARSEEAATAPLTQAERRPFAVVLAGASPASVERLSSSSGHAQVERLADGTLAVLLSRDGTPKDLARSAAQYARAIAESDPGIPVVLTVGLALDRDGRPVGPLLDRAADLLSDAPPGIWTDATTARLLDDRYALEERGDRVALVGRRRAGRERLLLGRESPFVGRERELRALLDTIGAAVEDERAEVALVFGDPGIGKTRLRDEVVASLPTDVEVLLVECDRLLVDTPYATAKALISESLGVTEDTSRESRRALVDRWVARQAPARAEALQVGAGLLAGLTEGASDHVVMQVRETWLTWLDGAERPVVLVVDDLQWCDSPSLDLFDFVLGARPDAPLAFVGLARPEVADELATAFGAHSTMQMKLRALPRRAADALVRAAVGEPLDAARLGSLLERAQGNPFALEELLRAGTTQEEIPDTVLGLVQARIDRCSDEARRLLRAASVYGREFSLDAVVALTPDLGDDARAALYDELTVAELIRPHRGARATREFQHALSRDAAYAMMPEDERRAAHAALSEWLSERGAPLAERAHHTERAGALEEAATLYRRAAAEAFTNLAFSSAAALVERGLRCASSGASRFELIRLGWRIMDDEVPLERRLAWAEEALAFAGEGTVEEAEALAGMAMHRPDLPVGPILDRVEGTVRALAERDVDRALDVIVGLEQAAFDRGEWEVVDRCHEILGENRLPEDPKSSLVVAHLRTRLAMRSGHRATEAYRDAMRAAHAAPDARPNLQYVALQLAAYRAAIFGRLEDADALQERLVPLLRVADGGKRSNQELHRGLVFQARGDLAEAQARYERAVDLTRSPREKARAQIRLAWVLVDRGEAARAEEVAVAAMALPLAPKLQTLCRWAHGRSLSALGRHEEAIARGAEASSALHDGWYFDARGELIVAGYAQALWRGGRRDEAVAVLEPALEALERWLNDVGSELAESLRARASDVVETYAVARELGLRP